MVTNESSDDNNDDDDDDDNNDGFGSMGDRQVASRSKTTLLAMVNLSSDQIEGYMPIIELVVGGIFPWMQTRTNHYNGPLLRGRPHEFGCMQYLGWYNYCP